MPSCALANAVSPGKLFLHHAPSVFTPMSPASSASVLYLIYEAGNVQPALDFCSRLHEQHGVRCLLYSPYYLPRTPEYMEQARKRRIAYLHEVTALGGTADLVRQLEAAGVAPRPTSALASSHDVSEPFMLRLSQWFDVKLRADVAPWREHYATRLNTARTLLGRAGVTHLLMAEDNVERDSACWIHAAHERGGRAFVISYAAVTPHEAAIAYWDHPEFSVRHLRDRLLVAARPRWQLRHAGRAMLRLPTPRAWALESMGLAPRHPWTVNTGHCDGILVESEFMCERFVRHGIDRARVHVTGTMPMDVLAAQMNTRRKDRAQWLQQHGLDPARQVLVCAVPPNQYPSRPAAGHTSYGELLQTWIQALESTRAQFNIIFSPHPSIQGEDLARLEASGCHVYKGGAMEVVALADLFVACVSTTIKWALACGVPVINFDCYRYYYPDYSQVPGVHECTSVEEFRCLLQQCCDKRYLEHQKHKARLGAQRFGHLDGNAEQRMVSTIFGSHDAHNSKKT